MVAVPVHPLLRDRVLGLPPTARRRFDEATVAMARRQLEVARAALVDVLVLAPECVEAQRLLGLVAHMRGHYADAVAILRRALAIDPDNALLHMNLGTSLYNSGEVALGLSSLRHACALAPDFAPAWFSLGRTLRRQGRSAGAITALHRAVDLTPDDAVMRSQLAEAQASLGITAAACANYRQALQQQSDHPEAWLGLSRWQRERFTADEVARLQELIQRADANVDARIMLGFALARGLEDQGDYHGAFRVLRKTNGQRRKSLHWNAARASAWVARVRAAFVPPPCGADDRALGAQVVFIAGLPRSGVGLLRRVLAEHVQVDAGDRSEHLRAVIDEESQRRQQPFPQWVADATPEQWGRLGNDYLTRAVRAHGDVRCFIYATDQDWHLMSTAMAMLPGARLVDCRRDAPENCFSCYRQLFAEDHQFSYDLDELASFWRDYDGFSRHWQQLYPERVFQHSHDALLVEPARQLKELLAFLQLDEQPSQVDGRAETLHESLRPPLLRGPRYGSELQRLRILLGLP